MRIIVTGMLLVVMAAAASCTAIPDLFMGKLVKGTEILADQRYDLSGFTAVSIGSAFEGTITRSDEWSVVVTVDESVLPYVQVKVDGNTLHVGLESHGRLNTSVLRVAIAMPAIEAVAAAGASNVTLNGFARAANFSANASGASHITGSASADRVAITATGASKVTLSGEGNALTLNASGASVAKLAQLPVVTADVTLAGASQAEVTASQSIDLVASGASMLHYGGGAHLSSNLSGGSSARERR